MNGTAQKGYEVADRFLVSPFRQPEGSALLEGASSTLRVTENGPEPGQELEVSRAFFGGFALRLPRSTRALFVGRRDARVFRWSSSFLRPSRLWRTALVWVAHRSASACGFELDYPPLTAHAGGVTIDESPFSSPVSPMGPAPALGLLDLDPREAASREAMAGPLKVWRHVNRALDETHLPFGGPAYPGGQPAACSSCLAAVELVPVSELP